MMSIPNAVEHYIQRIPIFPCGQDKKPLTDHGFKDASTEPGQVQKWWQKWPEASIGMPTGAASGFWVLDVDLPHGPSSLEKLIEKNGPLPDTRIQKTGGGGILNPRYLANLDARGLGPGGRVRIGRKVAYPTEELCRWMESRSEAI